MKSRPKRQRVNRAEKVLDPSQARQGLLPFEAVGTIPDPNPPDSQPKSAVTALAGSQPTASGIDCRNLISIRSGSGQDAASTIRLDLAAWRQLLLVLRQLRDAADLEHGTPADIPAFERRHPADGSQKSTHSRGGSGVIPRAGEMGCRDRHLDQAGTTDR